MADTRRLAMLKAVESYLDNGSGKPAGMTFNRFAHRAIEKSDLPNGVIAHGGGLRVNSEVNELVEHVDLVRIAIQAKGSQATEPDDTIDPYLSYVDSALMADLTLGGAVSKVEMRPTGETEVAVSDHLYIRIVQEIEVWYYRTRTDPEAAS